jgi:hypothetical protein
VLQERLLSPQIVHFTRNFVHFDGRSTLRCESMSDMDNCRHRGTEVKAACENYFALLPRLKMEGLEEIASDAFLSTWHGLERKFSTTKLHRTSMLLAALAGLSTPLRDVYGLTWSFGICGDFMLREMLRYLRGG